MLFHRPEHVGLFYAALCVSCLSSVKWKYNQTNKKTGKQENKRNAKCWAVTEIQTAAAEKRHSKERQNTRGDKWRRLTAEQRKLTAGRTKTQETKTRRRDDLSITSSALLCWVLTDLSVNASPPDRHINSSQRGPNRRPPPDGAQLGHMTLWVCQTSVQLFEETPGPLGITSNSCFKHTERHFLKPI